MLILFQDLGQICNKIYYLKKFSLDYILWNNKTYLNVKIKI